MINVGFLQHPLEPEGAMPFAKRRLTAGCNGTLDPVISGRQDLDSRHS